MSTRIVYVVKTKHGYLSPRLGGYRRVASRYSNVDFAGARVYTRRQDAVAVCDTKGDKVVECVLTERK